MEKEKNVDGLPTKMTCKLNFDRGYHGSISITLQ